MPSAISAMPTQANLAGSGTAVAAWHPVLQSRDMAALGRLLADDVVFHSPVVHTPQRGKAITLQ